MNGCGRVQEAHAAPPRMTENAGGRSLRSTRVLGGALIAACVASPVSAYDNPPGTPPVRMARTQNMPEPAAPATPVLRELTPEGRLLPDSEDAADPPAAENPAVMGTSPVVEGPVLPPQPEYPIDLSVALRLAQGENPEIARARTEILSALATRQAARVLLLPNLNAGTNYHGHNGPLQRSSGRILNLSEQSLYVGGGSRTLAAESLAIPAVNIVSPLTDAWFEPLAAQQRVLRAQSFATATANSVLMEVAVLYLDLLGAQARYQAWRLNETQTAEVERITTGFSLSGEGREADAERARVQRQLRHAEVQRAEGEIAVASARLARCLNLDPSVRLSAHSGPLVPIRLIDPSFDAAQLTSIALQRRPELAARTAEIAEAQIQLKEEIARPLLPFVWVGFSGGVFGGGSNLSQPLLGRFNGRTDFDVRLIWTLLNFGQGNLALQRQRRAQIGEAVGERSRTINLVRREVAQALALSEARFQQIDLAYRQLTVAEDGFREDLSRARQNLGRPIEVLDNLEHLVEAPGTYRCDGRVQPGPVSSVRRPGVPSSARTGTQSRGSGSAGHDPVARASA